MSESTRVSRLVDRLQNLAAIDEARFDAICQILEDVPSSTTAQRAKPIVTLFDAKPYDLRFFRKHFADQFELHAVEAELSVKTVGAAKGSLAACVFVNDCCDAPVIAALADAGVRLLALRCAGYNNVDLAACAQAGVDVVRVPAYSPHAVAEHAVALMLMLNRRLHLAYSRNRTGIFTLNGLTGFDMYGKTVGVVGTGQIGQCVARILKGFGCQVLAYDKRPNEELLSNGTVEYVQWNELLPRCDVLTLHVPLFDETYHMIDSAAIASMKPGVMLINTSRGGLIDTRALIGGLKTEQIGYAGLDVYEEEAGVFFHDLSDEVLTDDVLGRLLSFNNVVVTSHQAFLTQEALDAIAATTLASVREYAAGKRGNQLRYSVPLPG